MFVIFNASQVDEDSETDLGGRPKRDVKDWGEREPKGEARQGTALKRGAKQKMESKMMERNGEDRGVEVDCELLVIEEEWRVRGMQ